MGTRAYKHDVEIFSPETGEMIHESTYSVTAINNEDDHIKVYRYLNTVFSFKGIEKKLIPTLMEICNYMTFANKGQEVILIKQTKEKISEALGIGIPEIDKHIRALKKADVLRPVGRSVYAVNPFIVGRGKWSDIKELRTQFDCNSGLITTQSIVRDKITGETMAKITQEVKKNQKQTPGQMTLFDDRDDNERYAMQDIRILYEYDSLITQHPEKQTDIDIVFDILYDTLNSTKQTIRIGGEDKPQMVVIGKLMKLQTDDLIYSVDKYHAQTERIKNAKGYLLTILFNSREQRYLDRRNQESNDKEKSDHTQEEKKTNAKSKKISNGFTNFHQREYDYVELEKELLQKQRESSDCDEMLQNHPESESIEPDIAEILKSIKK